jgi:hypothetical protein
MLFIPGRKIDVVIVVLVCIFGMIGKCVLCYYVIMPLICHYYVVIMLLCSYYVLSLLCSLQMCFINMQLYEHQAT